MAEWWASFCVEEAVGHWARFFGGALRKAYKFPEEKIVYFRVHAEADLEEHATASWRMPILIGRF